MDEWYNSMFNPPRLIAFLLLSVGIHAGILLSNDTVQLFKGAEPGAMQVRLKQVDTQSREQTRAVQDKALQQDAFPTEHEPVPKNKAKSKPEAPSKSEIEVSKTPESAKALLERHPEKQQDADKNSKQTMTEPARFDVNDSNAQQADLPNQVRQRLQESLQLQLQYPEMARRRGWEGEVKISVQLSGEGRILDVSLAQSSGHRILDENTLVTLQSLSRLNWASALLNGKGIKIEIPVIYQLSRL